MLTALLQLAALAVIKEAATETRNYIKNTYEDIKENSRYNYKKEAK